MGAVRSSVWTWAVILGGANRRGSAGVGSSLEPAAFADSCGPAKGSDSAGGEKEGGGVGPSGKEVQKAHFRRARRGPLRIRKKTYVS